MTQSLFTYKFAALGCENQLQFYCDDKLTAEYLSGLAIKQVRAIEARYSRYLPESILSRINSAAGETPIEVDSETAALLDYAEACFKQSEGLFDITSGVLRRAWDFKQKKIPQQKDLDALLPLIGWEKVRWSNPHFYLPLAGMQIDFGGIGKEYAVDRAAHLLLEHGVRYGFVNLGGDLRVLGPRPDGGAWNIGIIHPRLDGKILGRVEMRGGALATSGDYERFFETDGVRYSHILNPKTGWPVHSFQSVSVFMEPCLVGGSASTIAMLLGEERGHEYLKDLSVPFILVKQNAEIVTHRQKLLDRAV